MLQLTFYDNSPRPMLVLVAYRLTALSHPLWSPEVQVFMLLAEMLVLLYSVLPIWPNLLQLLR